MEIINGNDRRDVNGAFKRPAAGSIYLGALLVLVGILWLLYNVGVMGYGLFSVIFSWQMFLVAAGGYLVAVRRWRSGLVVGGLGTLFVVFDVLDIYLSFSKVVLPILVMAAGVALILSRPDRR